MSDRTIVIVGIVAIVLLWAFVIVMVALDKPALRITVEDEAAAAGEGKR